MSNQKEITELLKNYKDLYDSGVISKEEYEEKKASLLADLNNSSKEEPQMVEQPKRKLSKLQLGLIIAGVSVLVCGVWGYAVYRIVDLNEKSKDKTVYKLKKDEMFFGYYPQREVKKENYSDINAYKKLKKGLDDLILNNPTPDNNYEWNSLNFMSNNSYNNKAWYKDVTFENNNYRAVYFLQYRDNSTVSDTGTQAYQQLAGYSRAVRYYFRFDPIPWRKLKTEDNKTLLMSVKTLDAHEFSCRKAFELDDEGKVVSERNANNYKDSSIREFINVNFYTAAFNDTEREKMQFMNVDNSLASTLDEVNDCICENTEDKVTLLSAADLENDAYNLKDRERRECPATDYAWCMGYARHYWTRTPFHNEFGNSAKFVTLDDTKFGSEPTHRTYRGVVPVIEITK